MVETTYDELEAKRGDVEPNRAEGAREMPPEGRARELRRSGGGRAATVGRRAGNGGAGSGAGVGAGSGAGVGTGAGAPAFPAPSASGAPGASGTLAAGEPLFAVDDSSDLPLWVQLRNRLAHLIRTGYFKAGEQLPSLRSLSAEAKVNYNTVTKAYRDLEASDLIVSVQGRGMYVQKNVTVDDSPENAVDAMAEQCVEEYRAVGLSFCDIQRRLCAIVQAMAEQAAHVADEKRGYYGKH